MLAGFKSHSGNNNHQIDFLKFMLAQGLLE